MNILQNRPCHLYDKSISVRFYFIFFVTFLGGLIPLESMARTGIHILSGATTAGSKYSNDSTSVTNSNVESDQALSAGVLLEKYISKSWSMEVGLLSRRRRYEIQYKNNGVAAVAGSNYSVLHVPLLLRVHIADFFSVGAGGYVSKTMQSLSSIKSKDYGGEANARFSFFSQRSIGFLLEARYSYGIPDIASSTLEVMKVRDISVFGGVSLNLGNSK